MKEKWKSKTCNFSFGNIVNDLLVNLWKKKNYRYINYDNGIDFNCGAGYENTLYGYFVVPKNNMLFLCAFLNEN